MEYARYFEVEQLLKIFPDMKGMVLSIRAQMENIRNSDDTDDDIAAIALRHYATDEVSSYSEGTISDRTALIAAEYETVLDQEKRAALKELRNELLLLEVIVEKISIGLTTLTPVQKNVLEQRYFEKLTWIEIADRLSMSEATSKERKRQGLERLSKISRITAEDYKGIMRLFE